MKHPCGFSPAMLLLNFVKFICQVYFFGRWVFCLENCPFQNILTQDWGYWSAKYNLKDPSLVTWCDSHLLWKGHHGKLLANFFEDCLLSKQEARLPTYCPPTAAAADRSNSCDTNTLNASAACNLLSSIGRSDTCSGVKVFPHKK